MLVAGCRYQGAFMCETSEQCGANATCQPSHYCSFMDPSCASGQKYDETAGPYAGQCVGEQAVDAGVDVMPDAAFDVATCPVGYNITIASSMSRYKLVTSQTTFGPHMTNCADDLVNATHLVIPETLQEIIELSRYIDPLNNTGSVFFIGVVQEPSAATPSEGWIRFDGQPLNPALWHPDEPDDLNGTEADHYSQVGSFNKEPANERMDDLPHQAAGTGAVCECDGKTIAPLAQMFVDNDPGNPN